MMHSSPYWNAILSPALSVLAALALDALAGDPPNRFHPTAWMGSCISFVYRFRPVGSPAREFAFGCALTLAGMGVVGLAGLGLATLASLLPAWAGVLLQAAVLKLTLSLRGLWQAAGEVEAALCASDLLQARRLLSWHLVSRETTALEEAGVAAATIESVAENACDGIIAPLFFFCLGGLPFALMYRFLNTVDSMLGYRDATREWVGKFPARCDDAANFLPARLAGLAMVIAAGLHPHLDGRRAMTTMCRDARRTASPNAGVPMSAMAGALGVELEKKGLYCLGKGLRLPGHADILAARRLMAWSVVASVPVLFLLPLLWR